MPSVVVIVALVSTACMGAAGIVLRARIRRRRTLTQEECAATLEAAIARSGRRVGVPSGPGQTRRRRRSANGAGGLAKPSSRSAGIAGDYDTM